ncbi:MAG: recombinase family protein [Hyphomonadaceae bacterium]|nr:recombinase family protein [Hyphomonadaceae bacterium]
MTPARPRAYSYLRMSTQQQLRGDSLRRQLEKSRDYAAKERLELVEGDELKDIGKSAFKNEHLSDGVLGAFLKRVENGEIPKGSYLLVENLDRLSRDKPLEAAALLQSICKREITVVTLIDGQKYTNLNDDQTQLLLSVLSFQRAHEESKTKQNLLQASWKARRAKAEEKPVTSVAPKWLEPVRGKDKKTVSFKRLDRRVEIVQRIFRESGSGLGAYTIARRLNADAVPTFGRSDGWQPSYIKKILGSRSVLGEYQPHHFVNGKRKPLGDPLPGYYPAIISAEVFAAANAAVRSRQPKNGGGGRTGENFANLFKGLLFCAHCGATMRLLNKGPPPKGGRYLACEAAHRGMNCNKKVWRYDHFERAFFHHADLHLGIGDALAANERMLPTIEGKIALARERLDGLKAQAQGMDESFRDMKNGPSEFTKNRRIELEDDLIEATAALDKLITERDDKRALRSQATQPTNFEEMYAESDEADRESKRALASQLIRSVVKRIDISTNGLACFFSERWRDRLDGSTDEAEEYGLFDPIDAMIDAPAFSIEFREWHGGKIVQPNPSQPEFYRFRCPTRPNDHQAFDVKQYRRGSANSSGEITFPDPVAEFVYWAPGEN